MSLPIPLGSARAWSSLETEGEAFAAVKYLWRSEMPLPWRKLLQGCYKYPQDRPKLTVKYWFWAHVAHVSWFAPLRALPHVPLLMSSVGTLWQPITAIEHVWRSSWILKQFILNCSVWLQGLENLRNVYPPVIKHGLLENTLHKFRWCSQMETSMDWHGISQPC